MDFSQEVTDVLRFIYTYNMYKENLMIFSFVFMHKTN